MAPEAIVTSAPHTPFIDMRFAFLVCLAFITVATGFAVEEPVDDGAPVLSLPVPSVPVVTTWGELGKLPPTILADGSEVRLGIQALKGPVGSAVAVYVLAGQDAELNDGTDGEMCGPVGVQVNGQQCERSGIPANARFASDRLELYAHLVPLRQPGDQVITIFGHGNILIAKVTITALDGEYHPWATVHASPIPQESIAAARNGDGEIYVEEPIGLGPCCSVVPAAPNCYGWSSIPSTLLQDILAETKADLALPIPEPTEPSPVLSIRPTATGVSLTLPAQSLPSGFGSYLTEHLLVRWWRNGKPWVPSEVSEWELEGHYGNDSELTPDDREIIRIHLTLVAEDWPQDTIEVQFLISPCGHTRLDTSELRAQAADENFPCYFQDELAVPISYLMLSPRITLLPQ